MYDNTFVFAVAVRLNLPVFSPWKLVCVFVALAALVDKWLQHPVCLSLGRLCSRRKTTVLNAFEYVIQVFATASRHHANMTPSVNWLACL